VRSWSDERDPLRKERRQRLPIDDAPTCRGDGVRVDDALAGRDEDRVRRCVDEDAQSGFRALERRLGLLHEIEREERHQDVRRHAALVDDRRQRRHSPDLALAKLGDERVALITEYAKNYATLTDAVADRLALAALDLETRRQAVKAKYFGLIKTALSPRTALRFLQIEHQLNLIIDLQISAALPIVQ